MVFQKPRIHSYTFLIVLCVLFDIGMPIFVHAQPSAKEARQAAAARAETLWNQAEKAQKAGDLAKAADLYSILYDRYSQSLYAKDALWQAATLYKALASETRGAENWEKARERFKQYTIDYYKADHYQEAYFEVGVCLYRQNRFREAMTQLKVFAGRFPSSPLMSQVHYWMAQSMLKLGKADEAEKLLAGLINSADPVVRLSARIGQADLLDVRKKYKEAYDEYKKIENAYPEYYRENPEFLVSLGKACFKIKDEEEGRVYLYRYINLVEDPASQARILCELGESYYRTGDDATAQKLYRQAGDTTGVDEKTAILCRFRLAQYRDDPAKPVLGKSWKKGDLADPAGDQDYHIVLETFKNDPITQDARYALFIRYSTRKEIDRALEIGREYLRNDDGKSLLAAKVANEILMAMSEALLSAKRYKEVYELYRSEYRHVVACKEGRLLFLVGQALEALTLYDQAANLYFRALGLSLTDDEKIDVYTRRANVYMASKDFVSADRLLKHLRKIYAGGSDMGEIYFLSGRLSDLQNKKEEALGYYNQAEQQLPVEKRRDDHALFRLQLLYALGRAEKTVAALDQYRQQGWLPLPTIQAWYVKLGDYYLKKKETVHAKDAYLAALGEGMPAEGEPVQRAHLRLSDIYLGLGEKEEVKQHLDAAQSGKDPMISRMAAERKNQLAIDAGLNQYKTILGPKR